jgi:hypothetical protein
VVRATVDYRDRRVPVVKKVVDVSLKLSTVV